MLKRFLIYTIFLSNCVTLKASIASEDVPYMGIEALSLPGQRLISISTEKDFDLSDEEGVRRYWKTEISLEKRGQKVWSHVYREYDKLEWVYAQIVPIRKNTYYADLDKDDNPEIAVLPWDYGMGSYREVKIFSVKNNLLVPYGIGKFNFENGPYVLLGCPKCSKMNENECLKCL